MNELLKDKKVMAIIGAVILIALALVMKTLMPTGGDTSANFGEGNNFSGANVNQSKTNTVTSTVDTSTKTETNEEKK